jgi:hypothetical protein
MEVSCHGACGVIAMQGGQLVGWRQGWWRRVHTCHQPQPSDAPSGHSCFPLAMHPPLSLFATHCLTSSCNVGTPPRHAMHPLQAPMPARSALTPPLHLPQLTWEEANTAAGTSKGHQVPLWIFQKAAAAQGVDLDMDETECILAGLISTGLVKGYIAHKSKVVVVSKDGAFPKLDTVKLTTE